MAIAAKGPPLAKPVGDAAAVAADFNVVITDFAHIPKGRWAVEADDKRCPRYDVPLLGMAGVDPRRGVHRYLAHATAAPGGSNDRRRSGRRARPNVIPPFAGGDVRVRQGRDRVVRQLRALAAFTGELSRSPKLPLDVTSRISSIPASGGAGRDTLSSDLGNTQLCLWQKA
jgi:hypothetical protein